MNRDDGNLILRTDSYKHSHCAQYPPGTETVYSYFESRPGAQFPATLFFGLQYLLRRHLVGRVVDRERIDQAELLLGQHFGGAVFQRSLWDYIERRHHGLLPLEIRAVPEGTVVPTGNVLFTIENTDPQCAWLTNFVETLLVQVWYPCTVATISHAARQGILGWLQRTGDPARIDFKLHDFGFRGTSSVESAGIGGLAHLVNFKGTDTLEALTTGLRHYDAGIYGFSIPATEHSTITAWGREHEVQAYRHLLRQYPHGTIACVSDSFDIMRACTELWGGALKDEVLARDGTLVVRPDSGDPPTIVVEVLERLGAAFGARQNDKGYRVLHDKVRVIQGDGCTLAMIDQILAAMAAHGWSADNIAFGMGGGLLQKLDRDTQRFAMKCSAVQVDGAWRDVWKQPRTDPLKNSKRGRLALVRTPDGGFATVPAPAEGDLLQTVFRDGELVAPTTFEAVRARAAR